MGKYNAVILAAGQGKRMKSGKNKQFIRLQDEPLIIHTLRNFVEDDWCKAIYLVVSPVDQEEMKDLLHRYDWFDRIQFVAGGAERQDSGYRGLEAVITENPEDLVMIHDGARPFLMTNQLRELAEAAAEYKAALLAVQVTDTIKQKTETGVQSLDRSKLWAAQTPQAFHIDVIKRAHQLAKEQGYLGTDDASLVEKFIPEQEIRIVEGSYRNVKLTTPEDLFQAEFILQYRK